MNKYVIPLVVLFLATIPVGGQQSTPATGGIFHWDSKAVQELGPEDAIDRSKALSAPDRKELINLLADSTQSNSRREGSATKAQLHAIAGQTRILLTDLDGDGKPEIIAQEIGSESSCSPTGNCPIWVFKKAGEQFKAILHRSAIQTFAIERTKSNGFRDLVLVMHSSATEQELHVYRWDGKQYRDTSCYSANWTRMVGDGVQDLKHPDVTPCNR